MNQQGMTLVEVLLAFFLTSMVVFSLLVIEKEQLKKLRIYDGKQVVYYRFQNLYEAWWGCVSVGCRQAQYDQWQKEMARTLPGWHSSLACASSYCDVSISWYRGRAIEERYRVVW